MHIARMNSEEHALPCLIVLAVAFVLMCSCSGPAERGSGVDPVSEPVVSKPASSMAVEAGEAQASASSAVEVQPAVYPRGWLAVPVGDVPAGAAVELRYLPDIDVQPQHADAPSAADGQAVVAYGGEPLLVDPAALLVNLPDVLPDAVYDAVYSYAAPSACAGEAIPGVTGQRLDGYPDGMQDNPYLNRQEYLVPCAYATALKLRAACDQLAQRGYRLLVYDAYRPMSAQWQLSRAFEQAYASNPAIAASLGAWSLAWYVAPGASGHNYGADVDVAVCDMEGNALPMPSAFDAFDEAGHLVDVPMDASSISPEHYRAAVRDNDACMALHEAFVAAGFVELASEWWHFGDSDAPQSGEPPVLDW